MLERFAKLLAALRTITRDVFSEVAELLARQPAERLQLRELLFGLVDLIGEQIRLAQIFVRAAMTRVQLQGALVVLERGVQIAGVAIRIAEIVLDIGIARVAQRCRGERR